MDKFPSKKSSRILCEIYAKLICLMLMLYLCSPVKWKNNKELSFTKVLKQLKDRSFIFFESLRSRHCVINFLREFLKAVSFIAFKEKRKNTKIGSYQQLILAKELAYAA